MTDSPKLRFFLLVWVVALGISVPATIRAHDVIEEQIVRISAQLESGSRLRLQVQVPLTAVSDAGLRVTPEGRLSPEATPALLQPVGLQVLRNLDLRDDSSLRPETPTVTAAADGRGLTINALYRVSALDGLSARLNAFRSQPLTPVVTEVVVNRPDGRTNHLRVSGPAARMLLDPARGDVARQFAAQAARVTLGWGDEMLMLVCVLSVPIALKVAAVRVGALIAGQAAGMLVYRLAGESITAPSPFPAVIAASIVVIAALYQLFGTREGVVITLTAAVAALRGTSLASAFLDQVPNSGVHPNIAFLAFFGFAAVEYVWIAALVFAGRGWLSSVVRSERAITYLVVIFAVHTALHHMSEAGATISGNTFATNHAIPLVTIGWLGVIIISAVLMSGGRPLGSNSGARS